MMGTGNVSELTDADTAGLNAFMLGVMSELRITHLLTTEVSPHARSVVREIDCARRMLFAAREDWRLPRGYDASLCALHERKPFPYSESEIAEIAAEIRDPSYRVNVSAAGIHVYNRDGMTTATDPFDLYPRLGLLQGDAPHAFYMGVELGACADRLAARQALCTGRVAQMGLCGASRYGSGHREPARLQTRGHDLEGRQAQAGGAVIHPQRLCACLF